MFERRLRYVAMAGGLFFLVLLGTLFRMQVVNAEKWRQEARELGYRTYVLAARRGKLLDRNGTTLAEDRLEWDLTVRFDHYDGSAWRCERCGRPVVLSTEKPPRRCPACGGRAFVPEPPADLARLAKILGSTVQEIESGIAAARDELEERVASEPDSEERLRGWWWRAVPGVGPEVVKELSLHPDRYPGLGLDPEWRRVTTAGSAEAFVGRVGPVWKQEAKAYLEKGYTINQIWHMQVGRKGVELALEDRLAAHEGRRRIFRGPGGEAVVLPGEVPARDGEDVRLTIDLRLQTAVADALDRAGPVNHAGYGAFVALRPESGEVLAMASWSAKEDGLFYPVLRLVPGSVFKVVTALAGLESGSLDPEARFDCDDNFHGIHCHHIAHGLVDLRKALEVSCNGYFASAAGDMGIVVLDEWANRLGFDRQTGIQFPGENKGIIPDPDWKARIHEAEPEAFPYAVWHPGETWQVGFGQGSLVVTPLQIARLMAIVANGGRFVTPTLVPGEGGIGERVVSPDSVRRVREALVDVVKRGTARRTGLSRFHAAGKTGTADLAHEKGNMAWFAGFAPADDPEVAFACCLGEVPTYGADAAGPVVAAFLDALEAR